MKKNIAMRVAAFLFILTMISTCAFATTFAKYTSADTSTDTARVAKWGVVVEAHADNSMFSKTEGEGTNLSVKAEENVVAPGMRGDFVDFKITGTPEVAAKVKFTAVVTLGVNWHKEDDTFYCPIDFIIGKNTIDGSNYNSADTLIKAIQDAIEGHVFEYAAGNTISAAGLDVSWKWDFEGNDDAADTFLGNLLNDDTTENDPKIKLDVICTVEQINTYPSNPSN